MSSIPVLEYVIASIAHSATPAIRPAHRHPPRHPQQNGNSAQIAAAAWFGFANPSDHRTISPDMYSITATLIKASRGLDHATNKPARGNTGPARAGWRAVD